MNSDAGRNTVSCPRCGAPVRSGDRFCANCGLRLPGPVRSRSPLGPAARAPEIVVLFGPAVGGMIGFLVAEAIVGELSADSAVLIPIVVLVGLGAILGGPAVAWLTDRVLRSR